MCDSRLKVRNYRWRTYNVICNEKPNLTVMPGPQEIHKLEIRFMQDIHLRDQIAGLLDLGRHRLPRLTPNQGRGRASFVGDAVVQDTRLCNATLLLKKINEKY